MITVLLAASQEVIPPDVKPCKAGGGALTLVVEAIGLEPGDMAFFCPQARWPSLQDRETLGAILLFQGLFTYL